MVIHFQQNYQHPKRSFYRACRLFFLLVLLVLPAPAAAKPDNAHGKKAELFNTVEFRGSLKALPKWVQIVAAAEKQVKRFKECSSATETCDSTAQSWQQMHKKANTIDGLERLKWVNQFFNRWPYRLDLETYGLRDYWATPKEFMQFSGDCEDYSISKYFALRQLGYPADNLRIVVLKDMIRNLGHAVLVVFLDEQIYVLDSISDLVLPHSRYKHYQPQYSVNEEYRWAHIRKFTGVLNTQRKKGP